MLHVVEADKAKTWDQRFVGFAILVRSGRRECAVRAPVKGVVEREYLVLAFTQLVLVSIAARQFEGCLYRLGAAIAEEGLLEARNLHQFLSQQSLVRMIKQVADMN